MPIVAHNRTFNRTGRQEIPRDCVDVELDREAGVVRVTGLSGGDWAAQLPKRLAKLAQVQCDISSQMFNHRATAGALETALDAEWEGLVIDLPCELLEGGHRIAITVTVSVLDRGEKGGLILARSAKIPLVVSGRDRALARSALRIVPHPDVRHELWRLELGDPEGPIVYINPGLPDWRETKDHPLFKYGILPGVVRAIYFDIAVHQDSPKDWAETWLGFPGASGLRDEMPGVDAEVDVERVQDIQVWASRVCEAISASGRVFDRFMQATGEQQ
jgi:hypothetical protein